MKLKFLFLLFIFFTFLSNGQEIKLKSAVVASGGSNSELSAVNISRWRLGEVHLVVLTNDEVSELNAIDWNVSSYPNPFRDVLNLDFKTRVITKFTIQLTDITGKKQWLTEEKTIIPNQSITLKLAHLSPALYLVTITPEDKKTQQIIKVQKH